MNKISVKRLCLMGVMIAAAMLFSYIESLVPVLLPVPGIRLGIANIVILLALLLFTPGEAFMIGALRILISALLFGNLFSLALSSCGFLLSFFMMLLLIKSKKFSVIGVSMAGGIFHNVAQLICAGFILSSWGIMLYLFPLCIVGCLTGGINGFICKMIYERTYRYDWLSQG